MSHFNVPFVFGYFSSWFVQRIPFWPVSFESKCLAALRTKAYTAQLLYWGSPYIILFPSQSTGLDIWVVIGADQLSPSESTASGPTALTFVQGEESVGPGGNLLSVERKKDCTPVQVRPRRLTPPAGHGGASGCSPRPRPSRAGTLWTVDLDLGTKQCLPILFYLGWEKKFADLKVVWCFEISIPSENLLKTWNGHMSPWDFWLIRAEGTFSHSITLAMTLWRIFSMNLDFWFLHLSVDLFEVFLCLSNLFLSLKRLKGYFKIFKFSDLQSAYNRAVPATQSCILFS